MSRHERAPWRGSAFGLELEGTFPAPGLDVDGGARGSGRRTELRLAPAADVDSRANEVVFEQPLPEGSFALRRGEAGGFLAEHSYYGRFGVSADGAAVDCAPAALPDWVWQRMLVGQMLPLAALLQGLEPYHASAVVIDGRALLLTGTSGAGKSSVALHLAAGGATFLADDVTAVEASGDAVVAHPGPALISVDSTELDSVPAQAGGLERLGVHDGDARITVGERADAAPVGALYVLVRSADTGSLAIDEPRAGWPQVLLGSTFNPYVRDSQRLERQLDVAARLAGSAVVREVRVPPGCDAASAADAVAESFVGLPAA